MARLSHPLLAAGFRPLFPLACLAGLVLPLWWILIFSGAVPPAPTFAVAPLAWHAHEMFYGYGWALLGGFLLTASKNWAGVRGWQGGPLALVCLAWLLDRCAMNLGATWPPFLFWSAVTLFQLAIVALLLHTLLQQNLRASGSDNYFFWIALPLFIPAKWLLLNETTYVHGLGMTLALFRLAFLLMLERTQVQFMRHGFGVDILRDPRLDMPIKWLAIVLVFAGWLPAPLAGLLEFALAALLLWRFAFWHPAKALSRIDIGIMYLGYLMIVAQLILAGTGRFAEINWVGTVAVHVFTVGVLGLVGPAMILRISKGHTGREVVFSPGDRAMLWLMIAGLIARVILPQLHPAGYLTWLHLAAACWLLAFAHLLWHLTPLLWSPRVDGKPG